MKFQSSLLHAGLAVSGAFATDKLTPDAVEADIREDQLQNVLWNFNKIARDNGGNRAFGLPGYNASLDFVLERAVTRFGKHMDTYVQGFTWLFEQTREISVTGPDGEDVRVVSLLYNDPTPLPGGVTGELVDTPVDDERGSACFEDQWDGIDAEGKIVLIKRGLCAIAEKLILAKDHGAIGVILYHNIPGNDLTAATLSAENVGRKAPVGLVTYEVGTAWKERLAAGETLEVNLLVDSIFEDRPTWNIISETKEGDPNNVIMLGAHLDSVQAGAGINDDGSGSAALLELMGSFKKYKGFKNKVRFAWWGAEEVGLAGSLYYGSQLSEKEADAIRIYYNYDMIGSKEPQYGIYADTETHELVGAPLVDYLKENGADAFYGSFGTSSDYVAFLELGIPSSGIFTGAGAPWDVCYHLECDDLDNVNYEALTLNAKAAGRAAAHFANDLSGVPLREKTSSNPQSKRGAARNLQKWSRAGRMADKHTTCGEARSRVV
ncbi:peptidase family m28 domain-containing protein [Sarocladium implicatum]|nr:peptidase family m28 domain-containing protein [Sarocladium implicatum]